MMKANDNKILNPKICLADCISQIRHRKIPPYSIMLVNGTPIDRISILNMINRLVQANWDLLAFRLREDITEKELDFSVHLMRNLAQEVNLKENLPGELSSLVSEYLHPFELSEKTKKYGIAWKFSIGKEEKFIRKEKYPGEIRHDYIQCFDWIQELQWKPILIIDSVERLSNSSERFLIDFLERHGKRNVTILGGSSESVLSNYVRNQGINKHFKATFIIPNAKDDLESKAERGPVEISGEVFELGSFVVNAFATESMKFNYLKFDVWHQLGRSDFADSDLNFDLCMFGHLRMREDYPRLIRTDYNCVVIIKILEDPITDMSTVDTLTGAAYKVLMNGVSTTTGIRFEPWDSFIFLVAPGVSKVILDGYEHLPYRNLFIVLLDGTFHNLSPHKWMDHILNNISRRWSTLRKQQGKPDSLNSKRPNTF